MLPIGVRIKVRSVSNVARKRSSVGFSEKKGLAAPKIPTRPKKTHPPTKKFLRTSKARAEKLAKKQAKKAKQEETEQEHQYHVLSRRPAWADDPGEFYGIYGSYYHHKQQQKRDINENESESEMSEARRVQIQEEQSKALSAHRRWLRKNKVTDAIGSKIPGRLGKNAQVHKAAVLKPKDDGAAILIYVGAGLTIIGLILTVVGAGNEGFKSPELQLIGPSLIGMGIFFCLLRILTCTFREKCARCCPRLCPPYVSKPSTQTTNPRPTTVMTSKPRPHQIITPTHKETPTPPLLPSSPRPIPAAVETKTCSDESRSTLPQKTSVSFENEVSKSVANDTNKATDGDSDFDLSEFEEVELDSPKMSQVSVKVRRKSLKFYPQNPKEVVLDPSKLIS